MTLLEALGREMDRGMAIIASTQDASCHVCSAVKELRAGACFNCKELVATDMINVWVIAAPERRWPYSWRGEPFADITDSQAAQLQQLVRPTD